MILQKDMTRASQTADIRHMDTTGMVKADRDFEGNLLEGRTKLESLQGHSKAAHTSSAK